MTSLTATWYSKLEQRGFTDIEQEDGNLKVWESWKLVNPSQSDSRAIVRIEATTEYYRQAGHFLYDHKFNDTTDRFIWQRHAEGEKIRDIVAEVIAKGTFTYKKKVHETIQRLKKEMLSRLK